MTNAQSFFCRSLAVICLALSANAAQAQTLTWSTPYEYDQGEQTSLSAHPTGLVLEAHKTYAIGGIGLWYRIGIRQGTTVTWGRSQSFPWEGTWPNVAISNEGYVVFIYSSGRYKTNSDLHYAVGMVNPYEGLDQSITWLTPDSIHFDSGFHSSTVINDNGVILEVHESGSGGTGLYYRVGHLKDPSGGDLTIEWDSGDKGVKYDDGVNPHIAINNSDQAIEVHQVTSEHYMHYRRGPIIRGKINFGGSPRYDNHSEEATVALLDNGGVVELHRGADQGISARTGILDPKVADKIIWFNAAEISNSDSSKAYYPAVTTDGTHAIGTWTSFSTSNTVGHLFSTVASLQPQEAVPFQWELPIRVVPRRADRKAKVRSRVLQTAVQPKLQAHGGASARGNNEKAKAHSPVPQKAVQPKSLSRGDASPAANHEKAKARSPVPQKAVQPKSQSHGGASLAGSNDKAKPRRKGQGNAP
jgi:hypothetical protein